MVREARLRSQTPMSQRELMPRCASCGEIFVGDFIEAADVAAVFAAQLRQPDVGAFGDEHGTGHPRSVGRELFVFVRRIAEHRHVRAADEGGPLLLAGLAMALGGFTSLGSRRVELHPDGQFFFAKNLAGHEQKALQAVAEQWLPKPPDQVELFAERGGRAGRGRPQKFEQAHRFRVGQRNERARGEVLRHLRRDFAIDRFFREAAVFKKFFKRLECLIAIRGPEQEQFFERRGAMRQTSRSRRQAIAPAFPGRASRSARETARQT